MSLPYQIFLVPILLVCTSSAEVFADAPDRQAEVAERGAAVMPFSLAETQHQFEKTERGGIQRVVVRDPKNREQIVLIRGHLKDLAGRFRRGDFSGPESIHGQDMPGLAELRTAAPGRLQVRYREEPRGASLRYRSGDKKLVRAIHAWFDAQVHDHGHDAVALPHCHHHP